MGRDFKDPDPFNFKHYIMTKTELETMFIRMQLTNYTIGTLNCWVIPKTGIIFKLYPFITHLGVESPFMGVMFNNEGIIYIEEAAILRIQEIIQFYYF